jgi:hypothetical protein
VLLFPSCLVLLFLVQKHRHRLNPGHSADPNANVCFYKDVPMSKTGSPLSERKMSASAKAPHSWRVSARRKTEGSGGADATERPRVLSCATFRVAALLATDGGSCTLESAFICGLSSAPPAPDPQDTAPGPSISGGKSPEVQPQMTQMFADIFLGTRTVVISLSKHRGDARNGASHPSGSQSSLRRCVVHAANAICDQRLEPGAIVATPAALSYKSTPTR